MPLASDSQRASSRPRLRVGRIPYINCYPVYGAVDRGIVRFDAELVDGVPTALNRLMAEGALDVSVVSAVEYARAWERYLLLPDLAISCDGPVRSVMLFSTKPAEALGGERVLVSRASMTSVYLLAMLFEHVWGVKPEFVPGDAETPNPTNGAADKRGFQESTDRANHLRDRRASSQFAARLVIGDAALRLAAGLARCRPAAPFSFAYDLGDEWKKWTGLPFVFAVWVAQRSTPTADALAAHAALIESRNWGLANLDILAAQAHASTAVPIAQCREYLSGLDYGLSYPHLDGLTEFYRRLTVAGHVSPGRLAFLPAA